MQAKSLLRPVQVHSACSVGSQMHRQVCLHRHKDVSGLSVLNSGFRSPKVWPALLSQHRGSGGRWEAEWGVGGQLGLWRGLEMGTTTTPCSGSLDAYFGSDQCVLSEGEFFPLFLGCMAAHPYPAWIWAGVRGRAEYRAGKSACLFQLRVRIAP